MGFFRRSKLPQPPQIPHELRFFSDDAWREFRAQVTAGVGRVGAVVASESSEDIALADGRRIGLINLAQQCDAAPRSDWPAMIDRFLAALQHLGDNPAVETDQLRVRLLPDDAGPTHNDRGERLQIMRPFAHNVHAVLAFDLPDTVVMASDDMLHRIGLSEERAWDVAWAQTIAVETVDESDPIELGDAVVYVLSGDSFYVASLSANLPALVPHLPATGALVGIPNRHALLVHPIEDTTAINAVSAMIPVIRSLYLSGPGSVSAHLYWWHDGRLDWLPATHDDESGAIEFMPPQSFVDVLTSLHGPST